MSSNISIIMTTCNGARYLSEQINSILGQSHKEWQLIIRDDISGDTSPGIIKDYVRQYPEKIRLITDKDGNVGVSQSFLRLLGHVDTDYVMFSDQDDVWLPDKIKITLEKTKECEEKFGKNIPVLTHTDLKVVDENLDIISDSFWKFQRLDPQKGWRLNRLLVQNVVTGCTVMINNALKDKIKLLPEQTLMYDWWISLVAAAFGKINCVPTATMLYRQHDNNDVGAKEWNLSYIMNMTRSGRSNLKSILQKTRLQAKAFLYTYRDDLTDEYTNLLNVYSTLDRQNFLIKRLNLIKYRFLKIGLLRNIGLFLAV